jgi:hypothetical protein
VARLEKNVLPQQDTQTFTPIAYRVNRLMATLNAPKTGQFNNPVAATSLPPISYSPALALSSNNYVQSQSDLATAQNANPPKKHSFLRRLGAIATDVGGMAARGMMNSGFGY